VKDEEEGKGPAGAGAGLPEGEELRAGLEERVGRLLGTASRVVRLERMTGGASRETWALDVVAGDGSVRALVLRRCRPDARHRSMALEARVTEAAGAAGVPVPAVLHASDDPADVGGPYLLAARVEGESIARRIFRMLDGAGGVGRRRLAQDSAVALARLHTVDPAAVDGLEVAADPVAAQRQAIDETGVVSPAFELALRWLGTHRPSPSPPSVVHGDFRVGNLIAGPGGLAAVLDWELAHTGDPLEDLGWFCARPWRFGEDRLEAGGLTSRRDWVAAYEAESGRGVEPEALDWWVTMANLNWGVICGIQAERHLSGAERSVELAAIGRRRAEADYDVLACLARSGWPG
jgi:aminoglycoside phosphotransferase (APT) family kinase protein